MDSLAGMVVAYQYYEPIDAQSRIRNAEAYKTWIDRGARMFPFVATQTSVEIGDKRGVPWVADVIDAAFASGDENIAIITNNDIRFGPHLGKAIHESCQKHFCYWAYRVPGPGGPPDGGLDVFAFTRAWWTKCKPSFPDLLLGYSYWDNILRRMMIWGGCPEGPREYFHTPHPGIEMRRHSIGELYNQRVARQWLRDNNEPE